MALLLEDVALLLEDAALLLAAPDDALEEPQLMLHFASADATHLSSHMFEQQKSSASQTAFAQGLQLAVSGAPIWQRSWTQGDPPDDEDAAAVDELLDAVVVELAIFDDVDAPPPVPPAPPLVV